MLVLIVCSLIAFSLETLPGLPPAVQAALSAFEVAITIIFTIEYALRVIAASRKRDYVLSIYGICDLLAILPFYVAAATGLDLRYLRAVRMLRIVTLLKLVRLNKAFRDFARTIRLAKEQLIIVSVAFAILLFISASGIYYFENEAQPQHFQSIFHSLWWAIVTLTTLGYGDVYPITRGRQDFHRRHGADRTWNRGRAGRDFSHRPFRRSPARESAAIRLNDRTSSRSLSPMRVAARLLLSTLPVRESRGRNRVLQ